MSMCASVTFACERTLVERHDHRTKLPKIMSCMFAANGADLCPPESPEEGKGYSQLLIHSYNFFHVTANNY